MKTLWLFTVLTTSNIIGYIASHHNLGLVPTTDYIIAILTLTVVATISLSQYRKLIQHEASLAQAEACYLSLKHINPEAAKQWIDELAKYKEQSENNNKGT